MNKSLLRIESLAEEHHDANFVNVLRSQFLKEQVHSIAEIAKLVTQLNRVGGEGLGLYLLDQASFVESTVCGQCTFFLFCGHVYVKKGSIDSLTVHPLPSNHLDPSA